MAMLSMAHLFDRNAREGNLLFLLVIVVIVVIVIIVIPVDVGFGIIGCPGILFF